MAQCLQPLLDQTYQNLEVILVNDVSYDRTGQICRDFAA
ncbi:glycosyltransferase [Lactobacillus ingluviei]|nr:glycosyltransferase [Limosilactobacillus ingluviei]